LKSLSQRLTHRELIQRGDLTLAFRAQDTLLDRPVFVKCLNPALAKDEEIRARFEREAKAVARLDHPNLVRIYEYGDDPEEGLFMLLEWLEGTTLTARIAEGNLFAGEEFTDLSSQLLKGLTALHSVGILHRDLKPDNILIRERGENQYKITDFSLAALRDAPRLTHHEAIVGTPAYMAPEQAAGGEPDERSDLYSLGVVLYEAATGENPFAAKTMLDTLRNVRELQPSFKLPAIVSLPERARELLFKLLNKDRDERPSSAQEALRLLGDREAVAEVLHERRSPLNWSRYIILAGILLVLGILERRFPNLLAGRLNVLLVVMVGGVLGISVLRLSRKVKPEYLHPRDRKRDLKFLGMAAAVIAFWAAMMLWYPWKGKDEGPMKDEQTIQPITLPGVTDTMATETSRVNQKSKIQNPSSGVETSEPELRSAPSPKVQDGRMKDETVKDVPSEPQISAPAIAIPDSVNLQLTTEPWAQIFLNGVHVGTTPLSGPLRVPGGSQTLVLRNPAFPPVQVPLNLVDVSSRVDVKLARFTALVRVNVEPWGELYLDGEHIGTTPLPHPLFVSPGHHSVRVSHPQFPAVEREFQTAAGETLAVDVDLTHRQATVTK
jgi:serine/threonine protein kinase